MQKPKIYSFSVSKDSDLELIEAIRNSSKRQGQNFSWVVIQALKQYQADINVKAKSTR